MTTDSDIQPNHSDLIILDAGPILNFMGRKDTSYLYFNTLKAMAGEIIVPDAVVDEVANRASKDRRFSFCQRSLNDMITGKHIRSLVTPASQADSDYEFQWTWVQTNCPSSWLGSGKNRGEMVLIAHARVLMDQNLDVVAMIDDQSARDLAAKAGVPSFTTVQLFQESVAHGLISDKVQLKKLYGYVVDKDDGLLPFSQTDLDAEFPRS